MREKEQAEQQGDREKLKNMLAIWETGKTQQTKPKQKVEKKVKKLILAKRLESKDE